MKKSNRGQSRLFGVSLLIILFVSLFLSNNSCTTSSSVPQIIYHMLIDNPTSENMIVYIDDTPFQTVQWNTNNSRRVIGTYISRNSIIDIRNTQGELFYSKRVEYVDLTEGNLTISVPASPKIRVYNPNHERVIISINGNPIYIVNERSGNYIPSVGIPVNTADSFSKYTIEALDSQGTVLLSDEFTRRDLENANWQLDLPPFTDTSFSITVKNLFDEPVQIFMNDQFLGDIPSNTEQQFSDLTVQPKLVIRRDMDVLWEEYLVEAKNASGDTVYSKDHRGHSYELNNESPIVISGE